MEWWLVDIWLLIESSPLFSKLSRITIVTNINFDWTNRKLFDVDRDAAAAM